VIKKSTLLHTLFSVSISTLALLNFTGCSATGPKFEKFDTPQKDKSLVYVYRTSFLGASVTPDIHETNLETQNDKILGEIKPHGYLKTEVDEGKYQIWAKTEAKNEVDLNIEKNKIYCIENYISMGFLVGHPQFKQIDLAKCEQELKETKLSN
jgi:hypothetical protein